MNNPKSHSEEPKTNRIDEQYVIMKSIEPSTNTPVAEGFVDAFVNHQRDDSSVADSSVAENGFASQVSIYTDSSGTHVNVIVNSHSEAEWWMRNVTWNTTFVTDIVLTNEMEN